MNRGHHSYLWLLWSIRLIVVSPVESDHVVVRRILRSTRVGYAAITSLQHRAVTVVDGSSVEWPLTRGWTAEDAVEFVDEIRERSSSNFDVQRGFNGLMVVGLPLAVLVLGVIAVIPVS